MGKVYISEAQNGAMGQLIFWLLLQNLKGSTEVFEFNTSGHEELLANQDYLHKHTTWYDDYMTSFSPADKNPITSVTLKDDSLPLILFGDPVIDLGFLDSVLDDYSLVFASCKYNEKLHAMANSLFKNKYNETHPTPKHMFETYKELCNSNDSLRKDLSSIDDLNDDELLIVFNHLLSGFVDSTYYLHDLLDIEDYQDHVFAISYTTLMTDAESTLAIIDKATGKTSSAELVQSLKNYHAAHATLVAAHPKLYI